MADAIRLRVLTDTGVALDEEAVSIRAPGEIGYLGILRHHAPLVTTLSPGKLTWRRADGHSLTRRLDGGFLEVLRNRVTILAQSFDEATA
ncbi:MAG: hypothetical protein HY595_04495 [Candidatus Omnitrophica bacterium]|nr:hypothetical protein [Candidatus Omnitrophota bacterium]